MVRAFQREASNLLSLAWSAPDGTARETLSVTAEHPFWVEGKGWTVAGSLQVGDESFTATGERRIVSEKNALAGAAPVFNVEV